MADLLLLAFPQAGAFETWLADQPQIAGVEARLASPICDEDAVAQRRRD